MTTSLGAKPATLAFAFVVMISFLRSVNVRGDGNDNA